ncbi:Lrp/AsnC family transcriptional regulator [Pendulispora brunnea]|uniref:Lrp/AsnC family transcriptional regulator n=1 Tax=Pendulispora brunnea TaxID=2905690 RepID=UPI00374E1825
MPLNRKLDKLDAVDTKVLSLLAAQGRMSWAELGNELGLSAPAAADRVKKLEQLGFIRGYTAVLDAEGLGLGVTAFIAVRLDRPTHRAAFLKRVRREAEVVECHHMAGDDDYLLKVHVTDLKTLETLVSETLKGIEGVIGTRTLIALSTLKDAPHLPLEHLAPDE